MCAFLLINNFHILLGSPQESSTTQIMNPEMIVKRDGDVFISVAVKLSSIGGVNFRRVSLLNYKWSLNGIRVLSHIAIREHSPIKRSSEDRTGPRAGGRAPGDYNSSFTLSDNNSAIVSLSFPCASTQDVGIYELQVFMSTGDLPNTFNSATCCDYVDFLSSSKGLKIRNILIGCSAAQLVLFGKQLTMQRVKHIVQQLYAVLYSYVG